MLRVIRYALFVIRYVSLRSSKNPLFYCNCIISATASSVLASLKITQFRYETEFLDDLYISPLHFLHTRYFLVPSLR